ncbi:GTPase [Serratia sarumanii]|uniref:GTPase n=2 Tax=Serratia TaxID=613 RepID=UPI0007452713|nr:GTPase [Serratia marcescens]MBH2790683.1 hypothetical protein [Serratia marcescens]MBI6196305.1 hypothetical protein [Serratia marcescens]WAZ08194.1 hypothetical protein O3T11_17155 [Serratia marcescens]CVA57467.1 Uncharacterised protein [Serratia marcescens]CVF83982.1 Uncharacterised protein [Serratia marcescens]
MAIDSLPITIKSLAALYSNRKAISEFVAKSIYWMKNSDVVVTGYPGVGKSYFFESLRKEISGKRAVKPEISTSVENKVFYLGDSIFPNKLTIIPGQMVNKAHVNIVDNIVNNKKLKGVIHILDWGHAHHRHETIKTVVSSHGIKSIDDLIDFNRKMELSHVKSMVEILESRSEKIDWFVFVLNKVDLYDRGRALKYYTNDDSFKEIIKRIASLTRNGSEINFIPVCSDRCNYEFQGKEIRSRMIRSEEEKIGLFRNFLTEMKMYF